MREVGLVDVARADEATTTLDTRDVRGAVRAAAHLAGLERFLGRLSRELRANSRCALPARRTIIAGVLAEHDPRSPRVLVAHQEVDVEPADDARPAPRLRRDIDGTLAVRSEVVRKRPEKTAGKRPGNLVSAAVLDRSEQVARRENALRWHRRQRIEREHAPAARKPARALQEHPSRVPPQLRERRGERNVAEFFDGEARREAHDVDGAPPARFKSNDAAWRRW